MKVAPYFMTNSSHKFTFKFPFECLARSVLVKYVLGDLGVDVLSVDEQTVLKGEARRGESK
jgi:hypothetical protein